jgi:hypothetical protein
VDIIFNRHPGGSPRRLPPRADINIKARFGKKGRQHSAVRLVTFFAHITNQDSWSPPFPSDKLFDSLLDCHARLDFLEFDLLLKRMFGCYYLFKSDLNVIRRNCPAMVVDI